MPISATRQLLTYYELDLGLNHVVRKWSDPVDNRANLLIPGAAVFLFCSLVGSDSKLTAAAAIILL